MVARGLILIAPAVDVIGGPVTPLPQQVMADKDVTQGLPAAKSLNIYCAIEEIAETPLVRVCKGGFYNL